VRGTYQRPLRDLCALVRDAASDDAALGERICTASRKSLQCPTRQRCIQTVQQGA